MIFVDGGPVDYLAWFALEGYDDHTFFYDDAPDPEMLRGLLGMMPREPEMPKFQALLRSRYETFEIVESATLFEVPDTYLPQFTPRPRANIGFFYTPVDDAVAAGITAVPRTKEADIIDDVEKLLPSTDVERFVDDVASELYEEIEAEIDRQVLDRDARAHLEADPDFRRETVTTVPEGSTRSTAASTRSSGRSPSRRSPTSRALRGSTRSGSRNRPRASRSSRSRTASTTRKRTSNGSGTSYSRRWSDEPARSRVGGLRLTPRPGRCRVS